MRILALLIFIIPFQISAQGLFTRTYGSAGQFNEGKDLCNGQNGDIFLCGSTAGWGAINGDIAVIKTDSLGNQLWAKVYGDSSVESGKAIAQYPGGGFVAGGISNGGENNDYQILLFKADEDGEVLWSSLYGIPGWNELGDIICLENGTIAVASTEYSEQNGTEQMVLWLFDGDGNFLWERRPEIIGKSKGLALAEYIDGSILVGGGGAYQAQLSNEDMLLARYASDGTQIWYRNYGFTSKDWIAGIAVSPEGIIALAGNRTVNTDQFSPHLYTVDEQGVILHELQDGGVGEVTSVAYNVPVNTFFFAWNYKDIGIQKTTIFDFSHELGYQCNSLPQAGVFTPHFAGGVAASENGRMMLVGSIDDTGPGIISFFLFRCDIACQHDFNLQVGIQEQPTNTVNLGPNPFQQEISITQLGDVAIDNYVVLDLLGRIVASGNFQGNSQTTLSTQNWEPGVYVIRLTKSGNPSFIESYRMIKVQ